MVNPDERLETLYRYANIRGNIAVKVKLDEMGGMKTYLTNDFDEPPTAVVELNNEKEEEVFLLFRFPEIKSEYVKSIVTARIGRAIKIQSLLEKGVSLQDIEFLNPDLKRDYEFSEKYFAGEISLFEIRCSLRSEFRNALFEEARKILGTTTEVVVTDSGGKDKVPAVEPESETKPVYKSKTVVGNILMAILIAVASQYGVELSPETVAGILAVVNIILRFLTKQPIKI